MSAVELALAVGDAPRAKLGRNGLQYACRLDGYGRVSMYRLWRLPEQAVGCARDAQLAVSTKGLSKLHRHLNESYISCSRSGSSPKPAPISTHIQLQLVFRYQWSGPRCISHHLCPFLFMPRIQISKVFRYQRSSISYRLCAFLLHPSPAAPPRGRLPYADTTRKMANTHFTGGCSWWRYVPEASSFSMSIAATSRAEMVGNRSHSAVHQQATQCCSRTRLQGCPSIR